MLSSAEQERYHKDGQITASVALSAEMVTELRDKMERFFASIPGVDQDYAANLIDQDNSWLKYAMLPEILNTVRALIGDDIIVWGSALFAKKGTGGKATPWHQDGHYWPIDCHRVDRHRRRGYRQRVSAGAPRQPCRSPASRPLYRGQPRCGAQPGLGSRRWTLWHTARC